MEINYKLLKSKRKSMAIQIALDGQITVRAPIYAKESEIAGFIKKHDKWIIKHLQEQKERAKLQTILTDEDILRLMAMAREILPRRLELYSEIMRLMPVSVKITGAKTRFGSCSGKNGICFSWRLMQYDLRAIDYVVVHELAHITHKNHGKDFYALIEKYLPDYKEREKLLKQKPL